jgi:hypothetical protein
MKRITLISIFLINILFVFSFDQAYAKKKNKTKDDATIKKEQLKFYEKLKKLKIIL